MAEIRNFKNFDLISKKGKKVEYLGNC